MRNGLSTTAIHNLPLNSLILVWREGNTGQFGYWAGPYNLLNVEGEMCTVNLPSGPMKFRSTVVKPYLTDPEHIQAEGIQVDGTQIDNNQVNGIQPIAETVLKTAGINEPPTEAVPVQKPSFTETKEVQPPC